MKTIKDLINKNRVVSSFIIVFVLLLLIMCIFWLSKKGTFSYNLEGGNVILDCPSVISAGELVSCTVSLDMVDPLVVYSVNARYDLDTNLTFNSFNYDDTECTGEGCFELFQTTEEGFAVLNTDGVVDGGYIGTLKFKVPDSIQPNEEFNVGLMNIELCYDDYGIEKMLSIDNASVTIHAGNNVATLSSLFIPDIDFNEEFNSLQFNYTVTVPSTESRVHFDYATTSIGATVSGNGTEELVELNFGHNIINFIVTAEDGHTSLTYTVDIYREYAFSTDVYKYIKKDNILYTGSDTEDEIINKLGDAGDEFDFVFDFEDNILRVISNNDLEHPVATINIVRFGVDYSIYDNIFYLNNNIKYSDLLSYINDENIDIYLYDSSNNLVDDLGTVIREGYRLDIYYDDELLATYTFAAAELSFDQSLVIDDDNDVIARIRSGTTVYDFKNMINVSGTISVLDLLGNPVSDNQIICTDYTVLINTGHSNLSYTLSVLGDVNGDGEIHINDVGMLYRYFMGYLSELSRAQIYAGDIINDGEIRINDVGRLYRYFMGYESSLEVVDNG